MAVSSKTHLVTVRLRVDKPITTDQARHAVWNAIHAMDVYGAGTPEEPWTIGKILVPRRPPSKIT